MVVFCQLFVASAQCSDVAMGSVMLFLAAALILCLLGMGILGTRLISDISATFIKVMEFGLQHFHWRVGFKKLVLGCLRRYQSTCSVKIEDPFLCRASVLPSGLAGWRSAELGYLFVRVASNSIKKQLVYLPESPWHRSGRACVPSRHGAAVRRRRFRGRSLCLTPLMQMGPILSPSFVQSRKYLCPGILCCVSL